MSLDPACESGSNVTTERSFRAKTKLCIKRLEIFWLQGDKHLSTAGDLQKVPKKTVQSSH